jgi:hypothetical protein
MINTAKFRLKNGSVLTLDREETEWDVSDGTLYMTWNNIYVWEIDGAAIFNSETYVNEELRLLLKEAILLEMEKEEDAEPEYCLTDVEFSF